MVDLDAVRSYLLDLQTRICAELAEEDGSADFMVEEWQREEGGGGRSRVARWLLQGFGMRNVLHCWLFGSIWTRRYKSARA